jgi:hypothetical protein
MCATEQARIVAGDGFASRKTPTSPIAFKEKERKGKERRRTIDKYS